ncbi:hypothetical protein J4N45_10610 [Vibrio sp. SCSIO 43140]|uniref:hypothetical protein n=1 Tax=Vibrio sp. SCSIO 43140 TaxID=2819100 RepID=UPI0020757340|nr:hypothetical protein [Vibrio sp. SCSIO 43140]USD58982.1 hypothetical protein J4N45_10610 [Vibrio sp. SCSIO 43140]
MIAKYIRTTALIALASFVFLVAVALGQASQLKVSMDSIQESILLSWEAANPSDSKLVAQYRAQCLGESISKNDKIDLESQLKDPVDITVLMNDCADAVGVRDMHNQISSALDPLYQFSWPLSLLDDALTSDG